MKWCEILRWYINFANLLLLLSFVVTRISRTARSYGQSRANWHAKMTYQRSKVHTVGWIVCEVVHTSCYFCELRVASWCVIYELIIASCALFFCDLCHSRVDICELRVGFESLWVVIAIWFLRVKVRVGFCELRVGFANWFCDTG